MHRMHGVNASNNHNHNYNHNHKHNHNNNHNTGDVRAVGKWLFGAVLWKSLWKSCGKPQPYVEKAVENSLRKKELPQISIAAASLMAVCGFTSP